MGFERQICLCKTYYQIMTFLVHHNDNVPSYPFPEQISLAPPPPTNILIFSLEFVFICRESSNLH